MKNFKRALSVLLVAVLSVCIFIACITVSADKPLSKDNTVLEVIAISNKYLEGATKFDYAQVAECMGKTYSGKVPDYVAEVTDSIMTNLTESTKTDDGTDLTEEKARLKEVVEDKLLVFKYSTDVKTIKIDSDKAVLTYTLTYPDMEVIEDKLDKLMKTEGSKDGHQLTVGGKIGCLETVLTDNKEDSISQNRKFTLTLEKKDGKWIVESDKPLK